MIIRLDEKIDCFTICKRIQKMIDSYSKNQSLENKIISIKIVDINDSPDYNIKRLEYKGEINV
jgi:hypothetical protein